MTIFFSLLTSFLSLHSSFSYLYSLNFHESIHTQIPQHATPLLQYPTTLEIISISRVSKKSIISIVYIHNLNENINKNSHYAFKYYLQAYMYALACMCTTFTSSSSLMHIYLKSILAYLVKFLSHSHNKYPKHNHECTIVFHVAVNREISLLYTC